MLLQSRSCQIDKEANLKEKKSICYLSDDNIWIKENTRLIQNEIKLLKENHYLREKLFHYENAHLNKVNSSIQTEKHDINAITQTDQSFLNSTSVSILYAAEFKKAFRIL